MGSPIAPVGQYGTPGDRWRVWQKNGLILDFWPRLFDITHNESHCGKRVILGVFTAVLGVRYSSPLRRFKSLGIGLKVVATREKRKVRIFQLTFFFVDFYAIYDICRLPSVEPRVITDNYLKNTKIQYLLSPFTTIFYD